MRVTIIATGFINNRTNEPVIVQKKPVVEQPTSTPVDHSGTEERTGEETPEETPAVVVTTTTSGTVEPITVGPSVLQESETEEMKASLKKADDILSSFMGEYDEDFVFLKKSKH